MPFPEDEFNLMCALKGVGPTVVRRLEELGFSSLRQLVDEDAAVITRAISERMGSTCWHNSPQARSAINAIIDLAKEQS